MRFDKIFLDKIAYIMSLYEELEQKYEVEHLHKYRVNLRKIYAYNEVFCKSIDEIRAKEFSKLLKKVIKPTSMLRDLDLFLIEMDTLPISSWTKEHLSELFELQREPLLKEIRSEDYQKNLHKISDILSVDDLFQKEFDIKESNEILENMSKKLFSEFFLIKEERSLKDLHKLRIKFKKFRYALELYKEYCDEKDQSINKMFDLKDLQDLFGIMQDNDVRKMLIESLGCEIDASDKAVLISGFEQNIVNAKQKLMRLVRELSV
jgi:CHAD domain-containing protein